jgi:rhodanese-related sulfurtransferase
MAEVPELTPTQFCARWQQIAQQAVVLLDVREREELALAKLDEAIHIPMSEIPGRVKELDPAKPLVIMCHSGGRSRRVAQYLIASGFEEVYNLAGGIDAWSREVDAKIPRY